MTLPFDRYAFKDMPFDIDGYDRLIRCVMMRPDFPKTHKPDEIFAYLKENPIKAFMMGSYQRGFNLIRTLSEKSTIEDAMRMANSSRDIANLQRFSPQALMPYFRLVGVATDKVDSGHISQGKRIWRYPEAAAEKDIIYDQVNSLNQLGANIPLFDGRIKTSEFNAFVRELNPDIAFMGTFGQLVDQPRIDLFPAGVFNFHPIGNLQWVHAEDAGPQPFEAMIQRGEPRCWMAMHDTNTEFDAGHIMGVSSFVIIPENATPPVMHRLSSPLVTELLIGYSNVVTSRMALHAQNTPASKQALRSQQFGLREVKP